MLESSMAPLISIRTYTFISPNYQVCGDFAKGFRYILLRMGLSGCLRQWEIPKFYPTMLPRNRPLLREVRKLTRRGEVGGHVPGGARRGWGRGTVLRHCSRVSSLPNDVKCEKYSALLLLLLLWTSASGTCNGTWDNVQGHILPCSETTTMQINMRNIHLDYCYWISNSSGNENLWYF